MAKKLTLEQLEAQQEQLRLQLQALEDSKKELAAEAADEARKVLDDALAAFNKLAGAAGKREFVLTPRGGVPVGSGRTRTSKPKGDVPPDALNKALHHLQQAKGKPVSSTELGKAAGYTLVKGLLGEHIGDGSVKVSGAGRATTYAWVGGK